MSFIHHIKGRCLPNTLNCKQATGVLAASLNLSLPKNGNIQNHQVQLVIFIYILPHVTRAKKLIGSVLERRRKFLEISFRQLEFHYSISKKRNEMISSSVARNKIGCILRKYAEFNADAARRVWFSHIAPIFLNVHFRMNEHTLIRLLCPGKSNF